MSDEGCGCGLALILLVCIGGIAWSAYGDSKEAPARRAELQACEVAGGVMLREWGCVEPPVRIELPASLPGPTE